ncbi:uncharacterized protein LOC133183329 [Saccostrea echinata]|uniref:uncharacterized protein LOC133183329 n=1 Tax=Saccostrea echinata TaxID=191078 RepID=UPI002A7EAA3F|nr:uncharacterized protein LOC133183329 [Saccostrea echinata]
MSTGLLTNEVFEEFRRHILPSCQDTSSSEKRTHVAFPADIVDQENSERILSFFQRADSLDVAKLLNIFDDVDKINRVDPSVPSTAEVAAVVVTFVERILQRVGQIDPRFCSSLLHGGSFYDGVKIGRPDEFDFTAKIEKLCSTGAMESRFSQRKKGFVYVVINEPKAVEEFRDFFTDAEDDEILKSGEKILSVKKIQKHFSELVDKALGSINVPQVLAPAEKEKGFTWHSVHHGPCATVYATYYSVSLGEMSLDIDIAPTFDLPDPAYLPPVLNLQNLPRLSDGKNPLQSKLFEVLQNELKIMVVPFTFDRIAMNSHGQAWSYEYSETWRVSFNSLEKFVFSMHDNDSVEKQLYRVLKVLKESFIQKTHHLESKAGTSEMKFEEPPSTKMTSVTVEPVGFLSDFSVEPIGVWQEESDDDTEDEDSSGSLCASGHNYEILYERSSSLSESDQEDDIADGAKNTCNSKQVRRCEGVKQSPVSPDEVINFIPPQSYRTSKPLIKTYYFKMILFTMKLLLIDHKMWNRENLPALVIFVLKILFFVYSSKHRCFVNFWFQEMIETTARQSVSLEILQSLEDILQELERKIRSL